MPRLDSFALPTLPGQDHMYPFGIIGSSTAARSHQAPLSKRNDNPGGSHLDAHRYIKVASWSPKRRVFATVPI